MLHDPARSLFMIGWFLLLASSIFHWGMIWGVNRNLPQEERISWLSLMGIRGIYNYLLVIAYFQQHRPKSIIPTLYYILFGAGFSFCLISAILRFVFGL